MEDSESKYENKFILSQQHALEKYLKIFEEKGELAMIEVRQLKNHFLGDTYRIRNVN